MNDGCPAFDQRGQPRPRDVTYRPQPRCDVGALEHQDLVVDFSVPFTTADVGGAVAAGPTTTVAITAQGITTLSYFARDVAGNQERAGTLTVQIDGIPPVITFTSHFTVFTIDKVVVINCTATDASSGVASTTCAEIRRPAYSVPLGTNTATATAVDRVGLATTKSTTFQVVVTYVSLCELTKIFSSSTDATAAMCRSLSIAASAASRGDIATKELALARYKAQAAAQTDQALTAQEVSLLSRFADAL